MRIIEGRQQAIKPRLRRDRRAAGIQSSGLRPALQTTEPTRLW